MLSLCSVCRWRREIGFAEQVINFHLLAVNGGAAVIDYHLVHLLVDVVTLFNKYK